MKQKGLKYMLVICLVILLASIIIYWLFRPEGHFGKKGNPSFKDFKTEGMISAANSEVVLADYRDSIHYYLSTDGGNNWNETDLCYMGQENSSDEYGNIFGMGYLCPVDEGACWRGDVLLDMSDNSINPQYTWPKGGFQRVSPVSREIAWVVTVNEEENILYASRTMDTGSSWESHELPAGVKGNKVLALDSQTCWVDDYRTTDGGNTWESPPQGLTLDQFTGSSAEELLLEHGYLFNGYGGLKLVKPSLWKSWGWDSEKIGNVAIAVTRDKDIVLIRDGGFGFWNSIDRGRTWRKMAWSSFSYDSFSEKLRNASAPDKDMIVADSICIAGKDTYFLGEPYQLISGDRDSTYLGAKVGLIFTHDGGASWQYASLHKYPTWTYKVSLKVFFVSLAASLVLLLSLFLVWRRRRRKEKALVGNTEPGPQ